MTARRWSAVVVGAAVLGVAMVVLPGDQWLVSFGASAVAGAAGAQASIARGRERLRSARAALDAQGRKRVGL